MFPVTEDGRRAKRTLVSNRTLSSHSCASCQGRQRPKGPRQGSAEAGLDCSKQKMPHDVPRRVDQCRCENRFRLTPCPAIEKAGDGSEKHVTPVGESHIG